MLGRIGRHARCPRWLEAPIQCTEIRGFDRRITEVTRVINLLKSPSFDFSLSFCCFFVAKCGSWHLLENYISQCSSIIQYNKWKLLTSSVITANLAMKAVLDVDSSGPLVTNIDIRCERQPQKLIHTYKTYSWKQNCVIKLKKLFIYIYLVAKKWY